MERFMLAQMKTSYKIRILKNSNKIMKTPMKKWTKRGVVFGGVWGSIVVPIIFLLFCFIFYDAAPPLLTKNIIFTSIFLPLIVMKFVFEIFSLQPMFESNYTSFFFNFIGWIFFGGMVGCLFGLLMEDK